MIAESDFSFVSCAHNLSVQKIYDSGSMAPEREIFFNQCSLIYNFFIRFRIFNKIAFLSLILLKQSDFRALKF